MSEKSLFNMVVCIIGIMIFLIHIVNLLLKRSRRKDENVLLVFLSFTVFHFAIYLAFIFIKEIYTSNALIMTAYTSFYIMNNIEVFLLFYYFINYSKIVDKTRRVINYINIGLFSAYVVLDIINIFTRYFFTSIEGIYVRNDFMILSQG